MALTGDEILYVQGVAANGMPAATTQQTTTQDIADLAASGGDAVYDTVTLNGSTSGTIELAAPAIAGTRILTAPAVTGTLASTTGTNLFVADVTRCSTQKDATTTTLANITGLTQTVVPGTYRFRCVLPGTADATGGIKYAFKYTTTVLTSIEAIGVGHTAAAVATQHTTTTTDQALLFDQAAAVIFTVIEGSMVVATGGTIALQQAEHAATSTASTYVGATMEFVRIV